MTDSKGPHLATSKALELADKLVVAGPDSADNFITAYKYAVSKKDWAWPTTPRSSLRLQMGISGGGADPVSK